MINPESINLDSLPWLPLEEKAAFPKRPSIYFAIDSLGNVQYIGRAVNVKQRWVQHHKYSDLKSIGDIKIAYLFVDSHELLAEIETALIQWFRPPLNFVNNPDKKVTRTRRTRLNKDIVTARQEGATEIRVFVTEDEKDTLKEVAARNNIAVSHLMRSLALAWIEENKD